MKRSIIAMALLSTMILTSSTFAHADDWSVYPFVVHVAHQTQWQISTDFRFSDGIDVYGINHDNIDGIAVYIKTAFADLDINDWMYWEPDTNTWREDFDYAGHVENRGHGVNIYKGYKITDPIENKYYRYDEYFVNVLWKVQNIPTMHNWRFDLK